MRLLGSTMKTRPMGRGSVSRSSLKSFMRPIISIPFIGVVAAARRAALLLERGALHNRHNDGRETVVVLRREPHDLVQRTLVVEFRPAPERKGQHLLGEGANELILLLRRQDAGELTGSIECFAGREPAGCVHQFPSVFLTPGARRVEILEAEPDWIHACMTG